MAPKKVEEPERKPLIGRVGTNLKVGIVGIPNVGKSTFFNVLTKSQAAAENFPFCTIDPNENKGYPRQNRSPYWPSPNSKPYPKPNIYYAFAEDTNPFVRIQNSCICLEDEFRPHFDAPSHRPFVLRDPYLEEAATRKYLESEPVSFVIFAKPGVDTKELGAMIADGWKCVLISPESLIEQEIQDGTDKGAYIKKLLRSGRSISPEIIENLLKARLNMRDVKHKGYIVEGLPLIPYDPNLEQLFNPKLADLRSRLMASSDYIDDDDPSVCHMILSPRSSETYEDIPLSKCKVNVNLEEDLPRQVDDMFTTWSIKPRIIVYAVCSEEDLIKKYEHLETEAETQRNVQFADSFLSLDTGEHVVPMYTEDDYYDSAKTSHGVPSDILRQNRERLEERLEVIRKNVKVRCEVYKRLALPVVDKWILLQNPQNVIRVDGRTSASQMFEIVSVRLRTLPLPRLLLPRFVIERIDLGVEGDQDARKITLGGEEDEERELDLEGMNNEDAFRAMTNRDSVALRFPWRLSRWRYYCPVELARGRNVEGTPKCALQFMKNIFFLSNDEAAQLFIDNPRTFLLPPNPRPTCKIAVIGPRLSGRSELCRELAQALDGTVVDIEHLESKIMRDHIEAKVSKAMRNMVGDVIRELQNKLRKERKIKKALKEVELREWYEDIFATIQRTTDIVRSKSIVEPSEGYENIRKELKFLRKKLKKNNLAHVETDNNLLLEIQKDKKVLYPYAPDHLRQPEIVRELTEHDPEVSTILQERVKHLYDEPIELTIDEKVDLIVKYINDLPGQILEDETIRDGGFVIDNMYMDLEVWTKILNDGNVFFEDLVIIFEDDPYTNLVRRWKLLNVRVDDFEDVEFVEQQGDENEAFEEEPDIEFENYLRHLDDFQSTLTIFRENLTELRQNVIFCDLGSIDDLKNHVVERIKDRYDWKTTEMSEEEKEQERTMIEQEQFAESMKRQETYLMGEDEMIGEEMPSMTDEVTHKDIRRLGDCGDYCPVVLAKYNVLWKGKEDLSAIFMNNIYLLSSEKALEEFLQNPTEFGVPLVEPPRVIPPLRIGIVGPPGSGKSVLADALSREYALFWVKYLECLEKYMTSRGMKAYRLKDDVIALETMGQEAKEEDEESIVLPEDINDIRYTSDKAIIYSFIKTYVQNGGPLPKYMFQECFSDYFLPPFDKAGIVLDGFPSCPQDAEKALEKCTVPEVVIELYCSQNTSFDRLLPRYMKYWEDKQTEAKRAEEVRYNKELDDYNKRRDKWIKDIVKKRRESLMNMEEEMEQEMEHPTNLYTDGFDFGYVLNPAERAELEEVWRQRYDEPVRFTDWEDIDNARERISLRLDELYESETQKLSSLRATMEGETIPWIQINAEEDQRKMILQVQKRLESYAFHNISMFERTHAIDVETAERLLEYGYYFLSSFGRWCPVQVYENKIPLQMFLPMELKEEVQPVIHRQYIYFLCGKDAVNVFLKNPFKYLEQDSALPLVPLNVSIIGPPKCGKTTLAERFSETYGLRLVSREKVLQHVSNNYSWTNLAKMIDARVKDGMDISNKMMARAVELYLIHPRATSQGYVLDDLPSSRGEFEELALLHIRPMIFIDLKADLNFCLECLFYVNKEANALSEFGVDNLTLLYERWRLDQANFREWLNKFSQNIVEIDAFNSKWAVWSRADRAVREKLANIRRYFRESDYDKVHQLESMCVSPYEFKSRQSIYESYCPVCLLLDDSIVSSGGTIDRTGVVQFREHFYWLCPKHLNDFIDSPQQFIPPRNTAILPKIRPRIVDETIDLEHACWLRRLQANGFCLVTYVDTLPNRHLATGKIEFALLYDDKLYLFCSQHCLDQFYCRWTKYCDVPIHFPKNLTAIDVNDLPIIGYLEQTVAKRVIEAVNEVAMLRPRIPGLTAYASAAIYMGVHLKFRNESCALKEADIYQRVNERLRARRQIVELATRNMKNRLNPFLIIPKNYFERRSSTISNRSRASSNQGSIKFRRTSPTQIMEDPEDSS